MFEGAGKEEATASNIVKREIRLEPQIVNLIEETRRNVACLDEKDRFVQAKIHLEDGLKYKNPRIDRFDPQQHCVYTFAYVLQTHLVWETLVQGMSFLYMYLFLFENGSADWIYHTGSCFGIGLFWTDLFLELLHSSRDKVRKERKYP